MTCTVVVILRVIYKKAWILYRACCLDSVFCILILFTL